VPLSVVLAVVLDVSNTRPAGTLPVTVQENGAVPPLAFSVAL
jgi:hypothetical protein